MGRYSPTVLPDAPDPNAAWEGLASALGNYAAARDYEKAQKEHDEDRAHMIQERGLSDAMQQQGARHAGIMPGAAPHEDTDITVPDGLDPSTDHLPFDRAMQPHPQGLASALSGQFDRAGGMRAPSSAPTTPGAFSIAGGGFHSPLKDQMGGGGGAMQQGAPTSRQPQGGGAPSHTLHMTPRYEQLTPDYYSDRDAEGPASSRLASALKQQKTEADIRLADKHADYFERGGHTSTDHINQLHERIAELMDDGLTPDDANRQARKEFGYAIPRPSTALPPQVRSAREAARSSRQDAGSFDRLAASFARPLSDPTTRLVGDTADFPARRDSVSKYRGKADSARAAASGYDDQANRGSGLNPPLAAAAPRANFNGVAGGSSSGTPSGGAQPRYTRQQIDSLYQDAIKRGADPTKAKARRDQLLKNAGP